MNEEDNIKLRNKAKEYIKDLDLGESENERILAEEGEMFYLIAKRLCEQKLYDEAFLFVSSTLFKICIDSTDDIDQALQFLEKVNKDVKNTVVKADGLINKK